jgi:hypothetical protein
LEVLCETTKRGLVKKNLQGKIEQYSSIVPIDNPKPNTNSLVLLFNNQKLELKRLLLKYESTTLVRWPKLLVAEVRSSLTPHGAGCHKQWGVLDKWAAPMGEDHVSTRSPYAIAAGSMVSARGQLIKGMGAFMSRERKPTKSLICWPTLFFHYLPSKWTPRFTHKATTPT